MHARLIAYLDRLRSSYWFIPSLMTIAAAALAIVMTRFDAVVGASWLDDVGWLYENKPDGARALLSTVAGSMIGVAGVTFSITMVAVVYASGQYGPRLLANFMRDRGNQVTLGTFISTFLYGLLVLRTIRSADEVTLGAIEDGASLSPAFVPHLAIAVGLLLALASVGVLIYFIHHVPESIHVSNVVAGVGKELRHKLDALFPESLGEPPEEVPVEREGLPEGFFEDAARVRGEGTGYVQSIDDAALFEVAVGEGLLLRMTYRPGDFVTEGETLALAWPGARVTDEVRRRVRRAFVWGPQRTALQDVRFLVDELVEIAARALSPSLNDPFTARTCVDWLGAALKRLAGRRIPDARRYDDDGRLRIVATPTPFEAFVEAVFGQLRPYVSADRNAALHTLQVLAEVAGQTRDPGRRDALRHHADALLAACETNLHPTDAVLVRARSRDLAAVLSGRLDFEALALEARWVGGSA